MAGIIKDTIHSTFKPGGGGLGDVVLQVASGHTRGAQVIATEKFKGLTKGGVQIILVNLQNGASTKEAGKQGAGGLVDQLQMHSSAVAQSEIGGRRTVISVDRIIEAVKNAGLDPSDAKDREKIERYVEHIVVHEVGHQLGLCEEDPCGGKQKHPGGSLMAPQTSLSDDIYISLSRNDLDKLHDELERRPE